MNVRTLTTRRTVAGLSLVAAGLAAGGTLASVGSASAASPSPGTTATATKVAETPLTGATLDSVKAAVLAKYPGATFGAVTTEDTGGYEAHITTAAGKAGDGAGQHGVRRDRYRGQPGRSWPRRWRRRR